MALKLKVLPRTSIKAKVKPTFPIAVEGEDGIEVTREDGVWKIGLATPFMTGPDAAEDVTGKLAAFTDPTHLEAVDALPAAYFANPSATIGLTANNGTATTAMRSDATPALSQAIAPTWTAKHTFTSTAGGIEMSGVANIAKSYAGDTVNFAHYQMATTSSNTVAEVGAHFGVVSTNGLANPVDAFKAGLTWDATAQTGSAGVWGAVGVTTLESGASTTVYGISLELDLNVQNGAYATNAAPYATNLLLTGTNSDSASNYGQAAVIAAYGGGANPLWNYGFLGVDYSTARAFKAAFISDQSRSPTVLHSNTEHAKGIDFASATFSGNAFSSPGFIIDGSGNLQAAQGRFNGAVVPNTDDGFALGSTSLKWSDLFLAEGGVINWDNGDVTITQTGNVLSFAGAATGYTFDALLDLSGAAAGQIKFPASQNASADANTLDDYEEGTWTPTITFATPGNLSVTYVTNIGNYTKIGNRVYFDFNIVTSAFTHTTASGRLEIAGQPFTSNNNSGSGHRSSGMQWQGITSAGVTDVVSAVENNSTVITVRGSGSGIANVTISATDMPTGGSVVLRGAGMFFI